MLEDGKISNRQAAFLIINTIIATSLLILPSLIYREAQQDAWISVILATVFAVVAGLVIVALGARFPQKTVIQYSEDILGKWLGKVTGLLYKVFFILINAFIIREVSDVFNINFLTETPVSVFAISVVFIAAYLIRNGLEVLARLSEVVFIIILILLLVVMFLSIKDINLEFYFPVLERGVLPVIKGAYVPSLFFAEVVIMLMIMPFLTTVSGTGRWVIIGVITAGFLQLAVMLVVTGVFDSLAMNMNFSTLRVVRYINIAQFIERIEFFIMFMWIGGGLVKVGIFYYCTVLAAAQWTNLREYSVLVYPTGALLVVLSILVAENLVELINRLSMLTPYFLVVEVGIPLLLLVLAVLRGKKGGKS